MLFLCLPYTLTEISAEGHVMTFTERSLWAGSEVGPGTTVSHPVLLSRGSRPWGGGTSLAHSSQGLDATEYLRSLNSR